VNETANKTAYVIFETAHGVINTHDSRDIRVLSLDGIGTTTASMETSSNPYEPGDVILGTRQNSRIIGIQMTALSAYRSRLIRMFTPGQEGRLTVNWGGNMRYIDYAVQDSEVIQETIARQLTVNLTLLCPDVFFNDMNDFGENIAAEVPMIMFPNLWYIGDSVVTDFKRFESAVALENTGDVPIGLRFTIRAARGSVLNPVVYLSETVYFRVYIQMSANDALEISTVRRDKYVRLNGKSILNRTDMTSTFFAIEPGTHKLYYGAEDGMENLEIYLYRRPQYWGV